MPGLPHADVTIDAEIVRSLMASSPWPAAETPSYWARGFDNEIWRVGHRAVRLPRRQGAVAALRTEQRWLNEAAGPLPVQSPAVLFAGEPTETFPYPWSVTHFVDGRTGFALRSTFEPRAPRHWPPRSEPSIAPHLLTHHTTPFGVCRSRTGVKISRLGSRPWGPSMRRLLHVTSSER